MTYFDDEVKTDVEDAEVEADEEEVEESDED